MSINWKVRFKNKAFWLALVPAVLLLIVEIAAIFGISLDFTELQTQVLAVVEALFALLAILGVVVDPTTEGLSDSERALGYSEPASTDNTNGDSE